MKRNIYLEGDLGSTFVPYLDMDCDSAVEVFQCLNGNFDDKFRTYMLDKHEKGVNFHIEVAEEEVENPLELLMTLKEGDIIVTPIPAGSKSGPLKIIAAIALLAVTYGYGASLIASANASAAATSAAATSAAGLGGASIAVTQTTTFMSAMGAAMGAGGLPGALSLMAVGMATNLAMAGVNQMMAPDPSTDSDSEQSYLFNGAEQNIIEGDPVPVLYGRLRVPGQPISFEVGGTMATAGGMATVGSGGETSKVNRTRKETPQFSESG
jgi:predicted phage tail protein